MKHLFSLSLSPSAGKYKRDRERRYIILGQPLSNSRVISERILEIRDCYDTVVERRGINRGTAAFPRRALMLSVFTRR